MARKGIPLVEAHKLYGSSICAHYCVKPTRRPRHRWGDLWGTTHLTLVKRTIYRDQQGSIASAGWKRIGAVNKDKFPTTDSFWAMLKSKGFTLGAPTREAVSTLAAEE